jgi:hypothetical protein
MDRRELIRQIAILTGAVVAGSELFLSGCKNADKETTDRFTGMDIDFFDEVAETILPKTDTPGAKDAEVGKFMASYAMDCYDQKEQHILKEGISRLNYAAENKHGKPFLKLGNKQKEDLLTTIDAEAKKYNETRKEQPAHYFTLMKQLVLLGFFTSQPGATQVLRYNPVPGKYQGCIDYKEGETSWA